jgi:transcriptional regulator with XRE-family HTH domain
VAGVDLTGFDVEGYRRRIRLLRKLLGMNQTEFVDHIGIAYKKWNHYERGYPVSRETAFRLREKIEWFSTDWLWHGDTRALSSGMLDRIQALEAEERAVRRRIRPTTPLPATEVRKRLNRTKKK